MRNIVMSLAVLLSFTSAQAMAFSKHELVNPNLAQPTQLDDLSRVQLVNRYVLSDESDVAYHNVIRAVVRDIGSDNSKKVQIVWHDHASQKSASQLRHALIKKGIEEKSIQLVRSQHEKASYPLYVEVTKIGAKKMNCPVDTAENMMSWDGMNACATKNNYRVQLKY